MMRHCFVILVFGLMCLCQQWSYAQEPRKPFIFLKGNTLYLEGVKLDKTQESVLFSEIGGDDLYENWKKADKKIVVGRTLNAISIVANVSGLLFIVGGVCTAPMGGFFIGDNGVAVAKSIITTGGVLALSGTVLSIVSFYCRKIGFSEKQRIIDEFNMGPTRNGIGLTFTF